MRDRLEELQAAREDFRSDERLTHPLIDEQAKAVVDLFDRVTEIDDATGWILEGAVNAAHDECEWLTKSGAREQVQHFADRKGLDVNVVY